MTPAERSRGKIDCAEWADCQQFIGTAGPERADFGDRSPRRQSRPVNRSYSDGATPCFRAMFLHWAAKVMSVSETINKPRCVSAVIQIVTSW